MEGKLSKEPANISTIGKRHPIHHSRPTNMTIISDHINLSPNSFALESVMFSLLPLLYQVYLSALELQFFLVHQQAW